MSLSDHFIHKTWVNFGWIDGHWSLNRSQILEFENFPEIKPEPDLYIFGSGLRKKNRLESENMSPAPLVGVSWFAESEVFGWCQIFNNTGNRSWIFSPTLPVEVQLNHLLHHTK